MHNADMGVVRLSRSLPVLASLLVAICPPAGAAAQPEGMAVTPLAVPDVPGSLGPNLASGPDGELILSWIQPVEGGHRLVWSMLGTSWSEPRTVAEGSNWFVNWADFPSVVPVSDSLWAAHWLVSQPAGGYAYDVFLSVSTDRGAAWSEPIVPHRDDTASEHGFVTIFPHASGFGAVWLDGRKTVGEFVPDDVTATGMTLRGATFTPDLAAGNEAEIDELVCDCCQTDGAVTGAGPLAVYRDRSTTEIRDISVARWLDGGWEAGRAVAGDDWEITGCPVNGPAVAADDTEVAVAWFTAASGQPRVRVARSADSGATFEQPLDIARQDNVGRVQVALLPDNGLAVSWLCNGSGKAAGVCLRRVNGDNSLGPVHVIPESRNVMTLSVPQLARYGDALIAAWTERVEGERRIRSARIPVDSL